MVRAHVHNVPLHVSVERLSAIFDRLGVEGEVHFVRDPVSARFAGEAYVATRTMEEAALVCSALNGFSVDGVPLDVRVVETTEFFDRDGLFADGEAPMGRSGPPPSS